LSRPHDLARTGAAALSTLPPEAQAVSPAARAYQLQLKRIEKLHAQLAELEALGQTHRSDLHQWVHPLELRRRERMRELALCLADQLGEKALSRLQREHALAALCELTQSLADEGDREMAALHDRHSPQSLAQKKQAAADALRARLEAAIGAPLDDVDQDASAEALLRAGMARLRQADEDEQERRRARAAARKAKKAPAAQQVQQEALQADADTTLRTLFRQLASALHPDREPDPEQRLRKTALMSAANAAYGRKDLLALMRLQEQAALADPQAASRMGDERLAALTLLLKQQVADLERERAARQQRLAGEFDLPPGWVLNPNTLRQHLLREVDTLEAVVAELDRGLAQVRTTAGLKRWLNARSS
jgi:hypothetical protein